MVNVRKGMGPAVALLLAWSGSSFALPVAQLDINGDNVTYNNGTQTVTASDPLFTLLGYGNTPQGRGKTLDTNLQWFLSVSLVPQTNVGTDFGSFQIDGVSYDTNDMTFGIPPLDDLVVQQGLLPPHGVYPTLYTLLDVAWDPNQTRAAVDVQTTPGTAPGDNPGNALMYVEWLVNVSGLLPGYNIHFDLFGVDCPSGTPAGDFSGCKLEQFAPFSHDAETNVPEPATLTLLGFGLLLVGMATRRRPRRRRQTT